MTIERAEFNAAFERLHDKLDDNKNHLNGKIEKVNQDVVQLQTRFDMTPTIKQPCCFFEEHKKHFDNHIDEHEKIRFIWIKSIIGAIVSSIATAIGTVFILKHGK
ncbi:MAG: hypothetical protein DRP56_07185 [Planctomycetota bacterium]|nr:MAG: hypothetical protein DRP56_07185 [Planctomycetota bacterium]